MNNATLYIVFHSSLHEKQYEGIEHEFVFAKVGDLPMSVSSDRIRSRVIEASSLSGFKPLGKHWAESEFIFALHRTAESISTDWVGFLQYDNTVMSKGGERITDVLSASLPTMSRDSVISFAPVDTKYEMDANHIAMDFTDPRKIRGDPRCYFPMIADYNKFYGTKHSYQDLLRHPKMALCSAFLMRREKFGEMMRFSEWVVAKNDLDRFDPDRKHRMAGGYMERYYAVWIALSGSTLHTLQIDELNRF